jgi:integrase
MRGTHTVPTVVDNANTNACADGWPPGARTPEGKPKPTANIVIREHGGRPFHEAKFRLHGRQVKRRIGPAWLERDPDADGWRPRKGRVPDGAYDERAAIVAAARIVDEHVTEAADRELLEHERRTRGVTFREVTHDYLRWLKDVRGAKPSTLRDHSYVLGEPGVPYQHVPGESAGHVMAALGDRPAAKITTRDINDLLAAIGATGVKPRTVNKYRAVMLAVYNYGCKPSTFDLPGNPVDAADKRREPAPGVLLYYSPEEVEAIAGAFAEGRHRDPRHPAVNHAARTAREAEDHQDAELVRVAAYTGLRQGELLALRWKNVEFAGSALTIARAMSAGVESTTKSGRVRRVPMSDQAAAAFDRLSRREHFTTVDERARRIAVLAERERRGSNPVLTPRVECRL